MSTRTLETLQLDGGCLAFDFINTVNTRKPEVEFDYLQNFDDILDWSEKIGSLKGKTSKLLRLQASLRPQAARAKYREAIDSRENLYALFSAIAAHRSADAVVVQNFNKRFFRAFKKMIIKFDRVSAELDFIHDVTDLGTPLDLIFKSAFDVLTMQSFVRIKECPRCGWIFLDTSKNATRRWCNMNVCGSRAKSLEYYYRKTKKH